MSTLQVPVETPPAEKRLYKSTNKFCNVITSRGKVLHFKMGMYITDDAEDIDFLDRAIQRNEFVGGIYIDPKARTITAEQENPMLALRNKFYEEFRKEQAEMLNPDNDMGTSTPGNLKTATTSSIAAVTAGGDAAARLIPLAAGLKK